MSLLKNMSCSNLGEEDERSTKGRKVIGTNSLDQHDQILWEKIMRVIVFPNDVFFFCKGCYCIHA